VSAPRIVVIGDSHASFFTGEERIAEPYPAAPASWGAFEVFHVGPGLASSLVERESENQTRAKALEILASREPASTAAILLCFGEIDCRFHIQRRAERGGPIDTPALERSAEVTAHRYISFVLELVLMGYPPVVFGPVATTPMRYDPPYEWPTLGSVVERNRITQSFDGLLRGLCAAHAIPYVSLFADLVDAQLQTRPEYLFDGVHLGRRAWPLFLARCPPQWQKQSDAGPLCEASGD
jgi:hypothetical protein